MEFSVIIPAHNEEGMLRPSLDSLTTDLGELARHGEIIIVANACTDGTVAVATAWLAEQRRSAKYPLIGQIIETETPGKKYALNIGLDASRGKIIICADGDVRHDPRAIRWTVDYMAHHPETQLLGTMAVANIDKDFLPADPIMSQLTILVRERWLSLPTPRRVDGTYFAFRSNANIRFPDSIAGDDLWISAYTIDRFGHDAIHVDPEYRTLTIAPQTWEDYINLNARYAVAHELLAEANPDLKAAIAIATEHMPSLEDDTTNFDDWQQRCIDRGIDFNAILQLYKLARDQARQQGPKVKTDRIAASGMWQRIPSTKSQPNS